MSISASSTRAGLPVAIARPPAAGGDRLPGVPAAPGPAFRPAAVLAFAFLGWTAFGALFTQVLYVYLPLSGQGHAAWWPLFLWTLPESCWWAACTLPVLALGRRFRFESPGLARAIVVHVAAALAVHLANSLIGWSLEPWLRPSLHRPSMVSSLVSGLLFDLLRYGILVAGVQAFDFRALYEGERRDALQLRYELLEAQLHMVRMQLQPHFLFNALHAISELIYRDARLADRALTQLADLLRLSLQSGVRQEVTLAEELEFLDAYLDFERLRAGDALEIRVEVDADTHGDRVPGMLLQPLVENALRHGVRGRSPGRVVIACRHDNGWLDLRVEDDGVGLPEAGITEGLGLRSTRARLRGLYGERQHLELGRRDGGGTVTRVRIPAHTDAAAERDPTAGGHR